MQRFERATQFGFGGRRRELRRRGAFGAGVGDAIKRGLGAASADREVHRAVVWVDDDIGQRKRFATDELLFFRAEARAVGSQVDRVHRAVRPIGREERVLVFCGEFRAGAE